MNTISKIKSFILLACTLGAAVFAGPVMAADAPTQAAGLPAVTAPAEALAGININTATAAEIAVALNGIGLKKAEALVAFRDLNGAFLQLEEISQVKGIGSATLEKNKSIIRFN